MTDDRDQAWRAFGEEETWDRPQGSEEHVERNDTSERSPDSVAPLSKHLNGSAKLIDHSVEQMDDAVEELRRIAGIPSARTPSSSPGGTPVTGRNTPGVIPGQQPAPSTRPDPEQSFEALQTDSAAAAAKAASPATDRSIPSSLKPAQAVQATASEAAPKPGPATLQQQAPIEPATTDRQHRPSSGIGDAINQQQKTKLEQTGQAVATEAAQKPEQAPLQQQAPAEPPSIDRQYPRGAGAGNSAIQEITTESEPAVQAAAAEAVRKSKSATSEQPEPVKPNNPDGLHRPSAKVGDPATQEMKTKPVLPGTIIEGDRGPVMPREQLPGGGGPTGTDKGRGGGGGGGGNFHKRLGPVDFSANLRAGIKAVKRNLVAVMIFTIATNILVLAIPVYLFQISDRVLTSRSIDTLVMLTAVIVGAVILQAVFDAIRRFILMRTAVEVAAQLGGPILSAAARASLHSNGREYQTLGDLQQLRTFLVSGTLLSFLDAPMAPLFMLAIFLIHPHLGFIVVATALLLLAITLANQRATAKPFSDANTSQSKANLHVDSMSRNSQIINALAMIPEAVWIWGRDTGDSLRSQVVAQDRNIAFASLSKGVRLLTQVVMLGWGAYLAIEGTVTGGMVIAASIIAGRALGPIEGAIEGWNQVVQSRAAYGRISALLKESPLNFERLRLPRPEGRLDIERLLYVPQGTKRVVLNGVAFGLVPGDSLAIIGNSGAGKTTLGKMLVGSILPTSGSVRLDLMDLRNWDQRQFGESIGYLPQDVQLFPGSIKANIARMREDVDDSEIFEAAQLADVHELIASLPHGYETFVAADGAPLSGGQKQRIALARAFFGNPRMVVLDEPNSNLDTAGETALSRALQYAKERKITMVTITQRPALLQTVDKILVLVNGTVALFGMRQDVLQALAARGMNLDGGHFGNIQIK